jgi:prevent-host-death family protein
MCYMAPDLPERVGVRELRQYLSVYLRRVQKGESLVVTERGRPVARLMPLPPVAGVLERLIEDGRAIAATTSIDDLPPLEGPVTDEASRALDEQREDRL